ncbi:MAG: hypothetical protein SVU88_03610 [Candidatus Nanohaloarchaea archaeon]|nr:hypothetical protein [Candidatus Nanohaloarchaea archaeon]
MEALIRVGAADGIDDVLETASWHDCGVELDLTGLDADGERAVTAALDGGPVPVRSIHYGRTATVSLQEWELFASQLDRVVATAERFGCGQVSVAPPRAEVNESHTVRDLQEFMAQADAYAGDADLTVCFLLDGFMGDPEMMNTAFAELADPSLAAMVDLARLADGVNPVPILEKMDVAVRKLRLPVPVDEVGEHLGALDRDVTVVAEPPR